MCEHSDQTYAKRLLRQEIRKRLREASLPRDARSGAIWERFVQTPEYRCTLGDRHGSGLVMGYAELPDEVAVLPFLTEFIESGRLVFPRVSGRDILPIRIAKLRDLVRTEPFGIREPVVEMGAPSEPLAGRLVDPAELELVIVPGLAFDERGHRLGRGRGYYDRFLAAVPPTTLLVSLAFECQIVDAVPVEPHDRPIPLIITEKRVIRRQVSR